MKPTILVVDDDRKTVDLIRLYLEKDGYRVLVAHDGRRALELAVARQPGLIILDLMLPLLDGLDVCRTLQSEFEIPIIMLTARTTEEDKLEGLDLGADDYVTKPFSPRELVARVRAVLRRSRAKKEAGLPEVRFGDLVIDFIRHEARVRNQSVHLTPKEFNLLETLVQQPGRVFSRLELLEHAFGFDYEGFERTVDVHVMNLRKKIEPDPGRPTYIQTVYGLGYKFEDVGNEISSLQIRLLLTMAVVVTVAVGTVAFFASRSTTSEFRRSVEGILSIRNYSIETRIHAINKLLAQKEGDRDLWEDMQYLLEGMARTSRARFVLADLQGYVLADSLQELVGTQIDSERSKPFAAFLIEKRPVLAYLVPLEDSGLERIEERFITSVNRSLLVAILAAGLVALLLSLLFSRSLLRPIGALTSAARAMEKGDLSQRVSVRTSGEIGELARAFNAMADGLARLEQLRRNMVTDVAHELRTPLSNVRGYLEALRDGVIKPTPETIASLHEEAMLLNRLVDDLQELALVEAGQLNLVRQPVQVGDVVERAVQLLEPKARKKGLAVEVCLAKDLPPIEADAERLGQVIRNLLDNALTNTPPGGEIRVSARTSEDRVEVSVQDTGQGIAPEHLPYVFERFYRADQSRTRSTGGAGLGLAIVKQLVEAHGGQVWIESQPGIGTTVTFTSPVATGVTNRASQPFHLQPATKIVER